MESSKMVRLGQDQIHRETYITISCSLLSRAVRGMMKVTMAKRVLVNKCICESRVDFGVEVLDGPTRGRRERSNSLMGLPYLKGAFCPESSLWR